MGVFVRLGRKALWFLPGAESIGELSDRKDPLILLLLPLLFSDAVEEAEIVLSYRNLPTRRPELALAAVPV